MKGNHDEAASRLTPPGDFNEIAERAIAWTRERLTDEHKEWLRGLPLQTRVHDFTIVHATLDTPEQLGYVFNNLDAAASFTYQRTNVCFFGHTHVPMVFVRDESVRRERVEHVRIEPAKKYFINMGSVGQPREPWQPLQPARANLPSTVDASTSVSSTRPAGFAGRPAFSAADRLLRYEASFQARMISTRDIAKLLLL